MSADEGHADGSDKNTSRELQFDRVETGQPGDTGAASRGVVCAVCGKSVGMQYYHVNDKPICESCRHVVLSAAATPRTIGPLIRAALFGLGGAIVGAAIYYAVAKATNHEIGLVAIVTGYVVGYSVHKGAGGRGGRRFQVLAAVLTYLSVGLAYAPFALDQSPVTKAGAMIILVVMLPVVSIVGALPFGLITALIIFVGIRQAWTMTAAPKLVVSGPYKVGTGPLPATS
jgi:hypothetical protein